MESDNTKSRLLLVHSSPIPNSNSLFARTYVMNNQKGETEESLLSQKFNAVMNGMVIEKDLSVTEVQQFRNIDNIVHTLSQLKELLDEAKKFPNLEKFVFAKSYLDDACRALQNGSFFTSIDALWIKESISFEEVDVTVFSRSHNVTRGVLNKTDGNIDIDDRYENTATGAAGSTYSAATTSTRSRPSFKVDIFGVDSSYSELAHLMPHSSECAATWFAFVPWVLNTPCTFDNNDSKWKYMSKCIHGFKNKKQDGANTRANTVDNVGLKHFPSNRIRLKCQKNIFDNDPCLLIVPIMTVQQVKSWNGEGYEAIVLAGNWESRTQAPKVYKMIEADSGTLLFATIAECDMACILLRQMVLCVCKSLKSTFSHDVLSERLKDFRDNSIIQQLSLLQSCSMIDVPVPLVSNCSNAHITVRKISFSNYDESLQNMSRGGGGSDKEEAEVTVQDEASVKHPAPDPALLCGKATCNWLKRMKTPFLAGCDDNSTSDSSDYIATYEEEAAQRGWSTTFGTGKEVVLHPSETFDESLSDDE